MSKQADMTLKGLAMALVVILIEETSRDDLERASKVLVLKRIEETS